MDYHKTRLKINNKETNYIIDTSGNIYNTKTKKYLSGSIYPSGYKIVRLTINGQKQAFSIHRLVAETFIENTNALPIVNHKDGNKLNNSVNNLEWCSYSNNKIHSDIVLKNKNAVGKRNKKEIILDDSWKKYYDTDYYVSNKGEVYNQKTHILLKQSITPAGYNRLSIRENQKTVSKFVHKMMAEVWIDDYQEGDIINHKDGNKSNNQLDNLEIVNKKENALHACYTLSKNVKPVIKIDNITHQEILYPSLTKAAKENEVSISGILYAIRHNTNLKNACWKYK